MPSSVHSTGVTVVCDLVINVDAVLARQLSNDAHQTVLCIVPLSPFEAIRASRYEGSDRCVGNIPASNSSIRSLARRDHKKAFQDFQSSGSLCSPSQPADLLPLHYARERCIPQCCTLICGRGEYALVQIKFEKTLRSVVFGSLLLCKAHSQR